MDNSILTLYKSQKTIFTAKELTLIWRNTDPKNIRSKIKYYVDKGDIIRLRRGIYGKTKYSQYELAVKIYTPAYISFETVLRNEGAIFQHYEKIFVASYLSREIQILNQHKIQFRKLKNSILLNPVGLRQKNNYFIASKERAFMDMVYLDHNYHFDNLGSIDWKKCRALTGVYENKNMNKYLKSYYHSYA